jgi:hypothetical protein
MEEIMLPKTMLFIAMYFVVLVIAGILPIIGGIDMFNLSIKYPSWQGFVMGMILFIFGTIIAILCIMKFWRILSLPMEKG